MKTAWLLILTLLLHPALPAIGAALGPSTPDARPCPLRCCERTPASVPSCGCAVAPPVQPAELPPAVPAEATASTLLFLTLPSPLVEWTWEDDGARVVPPRESLSSAWSACRVAAQPWTCRWLT